MNIFRFGSYLYGRLLFILLSTELVAFIKETLVDNEIDVELSEWKTVKLIKKRYKIVSACIKGPKQLKKILSQLIKIIIKTCKKERKETGKNKDRPTPAQKLKSLA